MPNPEKKILLVGDANSIFITRLSLWIKKKKPDYQVDVFAIQAVSNSNTKFYDNIIRLDDAPFFKQIDKLKGVRRLLLIPLYLFKFKKIRNYNYVHFQFISPLRYFLIDIFKYLTNSKIILSIWGSDMYRLDKWDVAAFKRACNQADRITFANPQSISYFSENFLWTKDNLSICRFGLAPLENLAELDTDKAGAKARLGWNANKIALTLGYNLSPMQQHLTILEVLNSEVFKEFKDNIQIILPISYAGTAKYKDDVLTALDQLPFQYFVYDTYLQDDTIALIRMASDIMVQVQTTDQFSGSMQEHLYAQNVVITGSWLPYQTMKEMGIYFVEIDDIQGLEKKLPLVIKEYDAYYQRCIVNNDKIADLSKWDKVIDSWLELYKS